MVSVQEAFYLYSIGFLMFIAARHFRDYVIGIASGLYWFIIGFYFMNVPITGLNDIANSVIAGVIWAIGAYIFIAGSIEALKDNGYLGG